MLPIRRGDEFCVASEGLQGNLIRAYTKLHSYDNDSDYNHSGIILNSNGETFEALWTARKSNLSNYVGRQICIYRPVITIYNGNINPIVINNAIERVLSEHEGDWYPIHRIFLFFLIPTLLKYLTSGAFLMCSEIVAKYEEYIGVYNGEYGGVAPDHLADRWFIARTHNKVFEGKWEP